MTNKMTKREWFAEIKAIVEGAQVDSEKKAGMVDFIDHEVELLDRKHSKSGQTKTQKENVEVIEKIKVVLGTFENPVTITEMQKTDELSEYSNQKLSALLKKLVSAGEVVRTEEKKKAYFSLA